MTKYGSRATVQGGRRFDSKAEARRALELCALEMAGEIKDLMYQVPYPLVVNGVKIGTYFADFSYRDALTGHETVEDVKSRPTMTPAYRLKKKLVLALYGVRIVEVAA